MELATTCKAFISLNVEGVAPGAYLLQVCTAQGVATQRVVLQ